MFFRKIVSNEQVQNEGNHQGHKLGRNGVFRECGGHWRGAADVQEPPEFSGSGGEHRKYERSLVLRQQQDDDALKLSLSLWWLLHAFHQ